MRERAKASVLDCVGPFGSPCCREHAEIFVTMLLLHNPIFPQAPSSSSSRPYVKPFGQCAGSDGMLCLSAQKGALISLTFIGVDVLSLQNVLSLLLTVHTLVYHYFHYNCARKPTISRFLFPLPSGLFFPLRPTDAFTSKKPATFPSYDPLYPLFYSLRSNHQLVFPCFKYGIYIRTPRHSRCIMDQLLRSASTYYDLRDHW